MRPIIIEVQKKYQHEIRRNCHDPDLVWRWPFGSGQRTKTKIRPKALQLRLDLEARLETLLTEVQKKQWQEMLGQPVKLNVIYDGL